MKGCIWMVVFFLIAAAYLTRIGLMVNDVRYEDGSHEVTITYCEMFGYCQDK